MNTIKTPKGTVLPLLNLKGKDYLQVAHRLVWFREVYPLGRFDTECVEVTDKWVIYKATVSVANEKGDYVKLADGIKREDFSHFADAHEKAQTGAIGRALSLCGFGTQFAPELDEEDRIVDSPLPPKPKAQAPKDPTNYVISFGKFKGKTLDEVDLTDLKNYADFLLRSSQEQNKEMPPAVADFVDRVAAL